MGVINVALPTGIIKHIDDFSGIINQILKQEIPINILKFSTDSFGTNLLLDVPEDKISIITELLKENDIIITERGRVIINTDLCIHCGACVSLCPTDALLMDNEDLLEYYIEKCVGCHLCLDSCPRFAIEKT
jgi:NAD-dependent dihydropyrimidine dehydrogenase PreA subunit